MTVRVEPARLGHALVVARRLDPELLAKAEAQGLDPRRILVERFRQSRRAWTLLAEGRAVAIGGWCGSLLAGYAEAWLAVTPEAKAHPVALARAIRAEAARLQRSAVPIAADLLPGDARAERLARFCGLAPLRLDNGMMRWIDTESLPLVRSRRDSPPFIVFALPRSRTTWLSAFLSYGGWTCFHEHAIFLKSIDEMRQVLARPRTGFVETAAAPAWPLLRQYAPGLRAVVVHRPLDDVVGAMIEAGRVGGASYDETKLRRAMRYGERCLRAISAQPGTLTVEYEELADEDACRRIFEHCLPYQFDHCWWLALRDRDIQPDLVRFFRHYQGYRDKVEAFKLDCKRELIRLVRAGEIGRNHAIH